MKTRMMMMLVVAMGCGHAPPPEPVMESQVAVEPAGEMAPQAPERRDATMVVETHEPEPVDPVAAIEPAKTEATLRLEPIDVHALNERERLELVGDDLIVEGMAIRNLPEGVEVYRVRSLPETFELRRNGERIALVERASWSYAARAERTRTAPEIRTVQVTTWEDEPVEVMLERRTFEGWRYQIERRPSASWLALRLELGGVD